MQTCFVHKIISNVEVQRAQLNTTYNENTELEAKENYKADAKCFIKRYMKQMQLNENKLNMIEAGGKYDAYLEVKSLFLENLQNAVLYFKI